MIPATDVWPGSLGNSSGELVHNMMDHHIMSGAQDIWRGTKTNTYTAVNL